MLRRMVTAYDMCNSTFGAHRCCPTAQLTSSWMHATIWRFPRVADSRREARLVEEYGSSVNSFMKFMGCSCSCGCVADTIFGGYAHRGNWGFKPLVPHWKEAAFMNV